MRGVTTVLTQLLLCNWLGLSTDYPRGKPGFYATVRNSAFLIQQFAYTALHFIVSVPVINILTIIGSLSAIIWDYWMYGTKINSRQMCGLAVGVFGVFVTVNA